MDKQKNITDIIIPKERLLLVPSNMTIKQALQLIKDEESQKHIQGIGFLIYGDNKTLVGTLCLRDIISGFAPKFLRPVESAQVSSENVEGLADLWDSTIKMDSLAFKNKRVSELAKPITCFIAPDDKITKAAYLMLYYNLSFIPVLQDKTKLLGIVTFYDVFKEISSLIMED